MVLWVFLGFADSYGAESEHSDFSGGKDGFRFFWELVDSFLFFSQRWEVGL